MNAKELIEEWFQKWNDGEYLNLPITDNFEHTSPYGTISGKETYINLVRDNLDKFLGHEFIIHDIIQEDNRACVRYSARKGDFNLEVSEWHYPDGDKIERIVAYYNIAGEIREDRQLRNSENLK